MRVDQSTWFEVESYLKHSQGIIIPTGSTEQHGPIGLIGTDALCAEKIAEKASEHVSVLIAPTLAYTPAPFNTLFPGTISVSAPLFERLVDEILQQLSAQGFQKIYFLNGHGANIEPLKRCAARLETSEVRVRSWWDFAEVNTLRQQYYADWEGMHATPSEIAITQFTHRVIEHSSAEQPPEKLTPDYIKTHSGDKHGPPDEHRQQFPDGRVGSHSALARPEHGGALLETAGRAVADDFGGFII